MWIHVGDPYEKVLKHFEWIVISEIFPLRGNFYCLEVVWYIGENNIIHLENDLNTMGQIY